MQRFLIPHTPHPTPHTPLVATRMPQDQSSSKISEVKGQSWGKQVDG
ncbi:MAG: hypothetical protein F6K26_51325 [Moorea sp. SIO2I5]|nr:hypothetical protein [Moorena sp. SIO2I5]